MSSGFNDKPKLNMTLVELEALNKLTGGTKYDGDKPKISSVPSEAIEAAARAMTYGAKKYGDDNFKGGIAHRRLYDAAARHMLAWSKGVNIDESGLRHLDHALASLCMLIYMIEHRPDLDDRFNKGDK